MNLPLFLLGVSVAISIINILLCFFDYNRPYMRFLLAVCLCALAVDLGAALETAAFAAAPEFALSGLKMFYSALPVSGVFFYFFTREYYGSPALGTRKKVLIFVIPVCTSVAMLFFPAAKLVFADIDYGSVISYKAGPLLPVFWLQYLGCIFASLHHAGHNNNRVNRARLISFWAGGLVLTAGVVVTRLNIFPGYQPDAVTLTFVLFALLLYLRVSNSPDWQMLGRDFIMQKMQEAYILVSKHGQFLDANETAQKYFPSLLKAQPGTEMASIEGIPSQIIEIITSDEKNADEQDTETAETDGFVKMTDGNSDDKGFLCSIEIADHYGTPMLQEFYLRVSKTEFKAKGDTVGTCLFIFDDTRAHRIMKELTRLAQYDMLSELYNRRTFFEISERDFQLHKREQRIGSIIMMDIDFFKKVNDTYGHSCGDFVIKRVSKLVMQSVRKTDVSGRYGGEELVVWLPDTEIRGARQVAEKIRAAVQSCRMEYGRNVFNITLSLGVAAIGWTEDGAASLQEVISNADSALYRAKSAGRNQVQVYSEKVSSVKNLRMF